MSNTELIAKVRADDIDYSKAFDYLKILADALEAAEQKLADAWDEGYEAGTGDENDNNWPDRENPRPASVNPYRVSA